MIERDIALVDDLRALVAENACVEFKKDNIAPKVIGKLCSALSNSARIEGVEVAYILWGIDDATHDVTGTNFTPETEKIGNQDIQLWLSQRLNPSIAFSFRVIDHPDGRVVILEIPAATTAPVEFDGTAYIRIGSTTPKLSDYPARFQKLIQSMRPYAWEKEFNKKYIDSDDVLSLIDYPSYFSLLSQPLPDNKQGILERLSADQIITKDVGGRWNITNLGAILFAVNLDNFDEQISRKAVRFTAYTGKNRASMVSHRQDGKKGYASGFAGLIDYINGLLPKNEHIGSAFREINHLFPEIAIRELIANALIHQDMTITGAGPQIELFEDRLEITNPGEPLVKTDRMIDLPPRSRNSMLGALMRRMKLCEEQGSGLDKVIHSVEIFQLPPPRFKAEGESMQAILYAPRPFAEMSANERIRACYQHAVIKFLSGEKMKNASLCKRFGIELNNAAQATRVINATIEAKKIKIADPDYPRGGYYPWWA